MAVGIRSSLISNKERGGAAREPGAGQKTHNTPIKRAELSRRHELVAGAELLIMHSTMLACY
jgi:hypothetical protein